MTSKWDDVPDTFLSEGDWAIGQGPEAPDRRLFRELVGGSAFPYVLEVGFGSLIDYEALKSEGKLKCQRYLGIDSTKKWVDAAKKKHPEARWKQQDVRELQGDRIYDLVWCRHVLEHIDDGQLALERMWKATLGILVISWFIRPSWNDAEVGCVYGDGFPHHTYSAPALIQLVNDLGARLIRIDFDHHKTKASIWLLCREGYTDAALFAQSFCQSPDFTNACLDVPERRDERFEAAMDLCQAAYSVLGEAIDVVEHFSDARDVIWHATSSLGKAEAHLLPTQDEERASYVIREVRDAKARCQAMLDTNADWDEALAGEIVQAVRDQHRRLEDQLKEAGRL